MLRALICHTVLVVTAGHAFAQEEPPPQQSQPPPPAPVVRQWDNYAGGVGGHQLRFDVFPANGVGLLVGYSKGLLNDLLSIGVQVTNQHQFEPFATGTHTSNGGVFVIVPLRIRIVNKRFTAGVKVAPAVAWVTDFLGNQERGWILQLQLAAHAGYWVVENRLLIGGGIEGSIGANSQRWLPYGPVLAGPFVEAHLLEWVSVYSEFKVGPEFVPLGNPAMFASRKFLVGVGFNF